MWSLHVQFYKKLPRYFPERPDQVTSPPATSERSTFSTPWPARDVTTALKIAAVLTGLQRGSFAFPSWLMMLTVGFTGLLGTWVSSLDSVSSSTRAGCAFPAEHPVKGLACVSKLCGTFPNEGKEILVPLFPILWAVPPLCAIWEWNPCAVSPSRTRMHTCVCVCVCVC